MLCQFNSNAYAGECQPKASESFYTLPGAQNVFVLFVWSARTIFSPHSASQICVSITYQVHIIYITDCFNWSHFNGRRSASKISYVCTSSPKEYRIPCLQLVRTFLFLSVILLHAAYKSFFLHTARAHNQHNLYNSSLGVLGQLLCTSHLHAEQTRIGTGGRIANNTDPMTKLQLMNVFEICTTVFENSIVQFERD